MEQNVPPFSDRRQRSEVRTPQRANDVVFVMQALYLAKRITVVDERLIDYRYNNANNLTSGLSKDLYSTYDAFLAAHNILKERGALKMRR